MNNTRRRGLLRVRGGRGLASGRSGGRGASSYPPQLESFPAPQISSISSRGSSESEGKRGSQPTVGRRRRNQPRGARQLRGNRKSQTKAVEEAVKFDSCHNPVRANAGGVTQFPLFVSQENTHNFRGEAKISPHTVMFAKYPLKVKPSPCSVANSKNETIEDQEQTRIDDKRQNRITECHSDMYVKPVSRLDPIVSQQAGSELLSHKHTALPVKVSHMQGYQNMKFRAVDLLNSSRKDACGNKDVESSEKPNNMTQASNGTEASALCKKEINIMHSGMLSYYSRKIINWICDVSACGFPIQLQSMEKIMPELVFTSRLDTTLKNFTIGKISVDILCRSHPELRKLEMNDRPLGKRDWITRLANYLTDTGNEDILTDFSRTCILEQCLFQYDAVSNEFCKSLETAYADEPNKEVVTVILSLRGDGVAAPCKVLLKNTSQGGIETAAKEQGFVVLKSEDGTLHSQPLLDLLLCFHVWILQEMVKLPVLLCFNGTSSQISVEVWDFCQGHGIILFVLHSDVLNGLKSSWLSAIMERKLTGTDFFLVLKETFAGIFKREYVHSAFKSSGLYCFHPGVRKEMELALEHLEQTIGSNLLQEFRASKERRCWMGSPNAELLFFSWLNLIENATWEPQRVDVQESDCCEITKNGSSLQCLWVNCYACRRLMHVEYSAFADQIERSEGKIDLSDTVFVCNDCPG